MDAGPLDAGAGAENFPPTLEGAAMSDHGLDVITKVRRALGRTAPLDRAPVPPQLDERLNRLVHTDIGLPDLFAKIARENRIGVVMTGIDELVEKLIEFLRSMKIKSVAIGRSKLLDQFNLVEALTSAGFIAKRWDAMTLDELYDFDCGITDAWGVVAEVGAIVMRSTAEQGRALSLVPPVHVAILEPKIFMPDLIDLFQRMPRDANERFVCITGPSKTADIEMTMVQGVHGPGMVQAFILQ
jgi:L-lactate dehydrogenase complex protein LldG